MTLRGESDVLPQGHPHQISTEFRTPDRNRPIYPHQPVPHELRHAIATAKTLAEQLEVADQLVLRRVVLHVRESLLLELEGFVEVGDQE